MVFILLGGREASWQRFSMGLSEMLMELSGDALPSAIT
jgi:hypothetical protein